ncbi:mesothelin-like protein-like, partial [Scleropages formosus]
TGALDNETIVTDVFRSFSTSSDVGQLDEFFSAFVQAAHKANLTLISNSAVRDTMLNLTLTALAPAFNRFTPENYALINSVLVPELGDYFSQANVIDNITDLCILLSQYSMNVIYNNTDFTRKDVYNTIRSYLNTGTPPKCYNATDRQLNSTAWFVNYIGVFITFITLDDLKSFVPSDQIQLFLENYENIQLFNNTAIPQDVISYYTLQLYPYNPNFNPLRLSPSVLQGFTCSGVRNFNVSKVKNIIRAFRPRQGRPTVPLTEMQSTCMYNYIRDENLQDFTNYPSDMLLYYNYENIEKINCKSYFNATGAANFGILSKILNKEASLLYNAISCLGISGTNLTRDQVEILGNMVCTLNASFIENSDPVILENLKHCRCTTGNITCSTIVDQAFPFGYSLSQFDLCLDANIVKNNQEVLISKVVDVSFQGVILNKLKEAYPSGLADEQVQQLRSVSRVASLDDINKWNITKIDTLFSLMISTDGEWESAKSKVIIMKYLGTAGNSLGTPELNCIGGVNLCSLDVSVIRTISSSSLSNAKPLDISNCSTEQKKELYQKANESFSQARTDNLTVNEVKGLLGANLPDLKTFENESTIHEWISKQPQASLDTLRIGLTGGRGDLSPTLGSAVDITSTFTTTT